MEQAGRRCGWLPMMSVQLSGCKQSAAWGMWEYSMGCLGALVDGATLLHVIQTLGYEVAFMFAAAQWISSWHWQYQDVANNGSVVSASADATDGFRCCCKLKNNGVAIITS